MPRAFRRGLVVGKFSPLHLGHERLIQQALAQCEQLYLLCYSLPELPGCEAARRSQWLQRRFPQVPALVITPASIQGWRAEGRRVPDLPHNEATDQLHRQFVADLCSAILGTTVDAVFTSEGYGDGFAKHLGNCFGHPVHHVSVDPGRLAVPVSGTRLREDVHGLRHYLSAQVYADFVERIVLLGAESTGKSCLADALARALGASQVAEFGREHWLARKGCLVYEDLLHIGRTQVEREDTAAQLSARYLVCDTSPLTTLFYSQALFGQADAELVALAKRPYSHTFLCADDFPFVQDGTRQDTASQARQHAWYRAELDRRGWDYRVLSGPIEQRVAQVLHCLRTSPLMAR